MSEGRGLLPEWRWWPALPLVALIVFAIIGNSYNPPPQQYQQTIAHSYNGGGLDKPSDESFWQRTVSDPVALFTFTLAAFTFVLALSTIGLWVVTWLTLKHARADASRQSSETQASLKIARDSTTAAQDAILLERAWIISNGIKQGISNGGQLRGVPFEKALFFIPQWVNAGRTPALGLMSFTSREILPRASRHVPRFQHDWIGHEATAVVGQNFPFNSSETVITDYDLVDFLNRETKVIVYAAVRYKDVFRPETSHITEVCFEVAYNGSMSDPTDPTGERETFNFEIRPIGNQSTAT